MVKAELIKQIILALEESLQSILTAATAAHQTATHEESVAENKYDTFGLEAAYLAEGLSRQVEELSVAIQTYRNACFRDSADGVIRLGSLIRLETEDGQALDYFLGPAGGGINIPMEDRICKVITPTSPLGQAVIGKEIDDEVSLTLHGRQHTYIIRHTS